MPNVVRHSKGFEEMAQRAFYSLSPAEAAILMVGTRAEKAATLKKIRGDFAKNETENRHSV